MKLCRNLMCFLILSAVPLCAQLEDADNATQTTCRQSLAVPLPAEASHVDTPVKWPDCNSYKLYYGIGAKVDFAATRKCAWSERLAQQKNIEPQYEISSVFGGSAMLTVLYANGEGVKQDYPLAMRFACEAGGAPAEIHIRLKHLESLSAKPAPGVKFSFCDDITSGFMQGFCAGLNSELANQERTENLNTLAAQMTEVQHQAFEALLNAEKAYASAHAKGEIDLAGTARAMFEIDAEQSLQDDFLAALRAYEKQEGFPVNSTNDYRAADAHLNSVYKTALTVAEAHKTEYGAIQPDGIRTTERAWLKYRDAWVAFARLRYPEVSPEAWLTLLTKDRTSVLDGSFCDMDDNDGKCAQQGDTWKPSPLP